MQDLHDFETEYNQIPEDLGDLYETECREHLLTKLPQHLTAWVGEQETRLRTERLKVIMNLGEEYSAAEIQATVQKTFGITPHSRIMRNQDHQTERNLDAISNLSH